MYNLGETIPVVQPAGGDARLVVWLGTATGALAGYYSTKRKPTAIKAVAIIGLGFVGGFAGMSYSLANMFSTRPSFSGDKPTWNG